MMRTTYDPEADASYAGFAPDGVGVAHTEEVAPGVNIDLDEARHMVGIEVLSVSVRGNGAYGVAPVRSAAE